MINQEQWDAIPDALPGLSVDLSPLQGLISSLSAKLDAVSSDLTAVKRLMEKTRRRSRLLSMALTSFDKAIGCGGDGGAWSLPNRAAGQRR